MRNNNEPLHNWSMLGQCFDILKVDPLMIEAGAMAQPAFSGLEATTLPSSEADDGSDGPKAWKNTSDGAWKIPAWTAFSAATGGERSSQTISLSSSYDLREHIRISGEVSASDPTGDLASCTLSASWEQTRETTTNRGNVMTLTTETIRTGRLDVDYQGEVSPPVSRRLLDAIRALPDAPGNAYESFVKTFGTHFSDSVMFGGRVHQTIKIERESYSSMIEEGIDVSSQANLTFEIAKGSAKADLANSKMKKFDDATENSTDVIRYSGGLPQEMFDMWANTVPEEPTAIEVQLKPLYQIFDRVKAPDIDGLSTKLAHLKDAIESYLRKNGQVVGGELIGAGDLVALRMIAPGEERFLSSSNDGSVSTKACEGRLPTLGDVGLLWQFRPADPKASVDYNQPLSLISKAKSALLDSNRGSDQVYAKGDGLVTTFSGTGSSPDVLWRAISAEGRDRANVVNGDFIMLQSEWKNPDNYRGFLQGDAKDDAVQRVFSFGKKRSLATVWQVVKI
jgi:hypothetical protein